LGWRVGCNPTRYPGAANVRLVLHPYYPLRSDGNDDWSLSFCFQDELTAVSTSYYVFATGSADVEVDCSVNGSIFIRGVSGGSSSLLWQGNQIYLAEAEKVIFPCVGLSTFSHQSGIQIVAVTRFDEQYEGVLLGLAGIVCGALIAAVLIRRWL